MFFQQSPKMLKIVSENFIHALFFFLGLFLKTSRWVPLNSLLTPPLSFIFGFPNRGMSFSARPVVGPHT